MESEKRVKKLEEVLSLGGEDFPLFILELGGETEEDIRLAVEEWHRKPAPKFNVVVPRLEKEKRQSLIQSPENQNSL